MTEAQQSLEAVRAIARSFCDTLDQSQDLSGTELLRKLNESLAQIYPLGRALPLTDPPPDDPDNEALLDESSDEQAMILAARADAEMQSYLSHYHRGQGILARRLAAGDVPNSARPASQNANDRSVTKEALGDLLATVYAGLGDLFDLEADKDTDARIWYWRTQLTGAWAQSQLLPASLVLQTYVDALA